MCDHVWIFEARTLSTQPVRRRCGICGVYRMEPRGAENRAHRHANFGLAGAHGTRPVPIAQELGRHTQSRQDVQPTMLRIQALHLDQL